MPGILDLLTGQTGASPWNALYPSSLNAEADQAQQAREAAAAALARRFRGAPAEPAAPEFGAGAVPFGFAGPGSLNVDTSQMSPAPAPAASPFATGAKPVPFAAGPVTAQPPAGPATDISSVNRDRAADDFISVGNYQMPAFRGEAPAAPAEAPTAAPAVARGAPPAAAPFSLAGFGDAAGDRLMKATRGFLGNIGNGPLGALAGGVGALVTGQNTDPSSIASEQGGMTARALLAKGATPAEVQAARSNPVLMSELVKQYFGPKTVTPLGEGYVWDARAGKAVKAYEPAVKSADSIEARKQAAASLGLKPGDAAYNSYVLTGKMPREDAQPLSATDKKAIQDADEKILTVRGVIDNLSQAKSLSKQSYDGFLAAQRGGIGANLGLDGGVNTADLDNLVTGNALGQLKVIFGGNPTEGERKILLEVQGSVNQPDAVRQRIWDRAIAIAQNKLAMEEQRANELRGGTFYKQGGGMSAPRAPAATPGIPAGWSVQQR